MTAQPAITAQQVLDTLRATRGEVASTFRYSEPDSGKRCRNWDQVLGRDGPLGSRCLVGEVLHRLGLLDGVPDAYVGGAVTTVANFVPMEPAALVMLSEAQIAQDRGKTWWEAIAAAEAVAAS